MAPSTDAVAHRRTVAETIARAGALAGVLDILAAFIHAGLRGGVSPVRVLQYVASGVLGPAAFRAGAAGAALGLALHFVIATGAAAVFYAASRQWPVLLRRAVPSGLAYGVIVYFVMNLVVVPLSAVSRRSAGPDPLMIAIHMFCVGLPIALVVRRFGPRRA